VKLVDRLLSDLAKLPSTLLIGFNISSIVAHLRMELIVRRDAHFKLKLGRGRFLTKWVSIELTLPLGTAMEGLDFLSKIVYI